MEQSRRNELEGIVVEQVQRPAPVSDAAASADRALARTEVDQPDLPDSAARSPSTSPTRRTTIPEQADVWRAMHSEILANVYTDPDRHTVSLLLDERTANAVIYAVRLHAAEIEAQAREARIIGGMKVPGSYGALNRAFIAIRHERQAERLRRLESNYRDEVGGGGKAA